MRATRQLGQDSTAPRPAGKSMAGGNAGLAGAFGNQYRANPAHIRHLCPARAAKGKGVMTSDDTPGFTPNAALIVAEIARVRQSRSDLCTIAAQLDHALQYLEDCLERGKHGASKVYLMHRSTLRLPRPDAAACHRRNHRKGTLSKLTTDRA